MKKKKILLCYVRVWTSHLELAIKNTFNRPPFKYTWRKQKIKLEKLKEYNLLDGGLNAWKQGIFPLDDYKICYLSPVLMEFNNGQWFFVFCVLQKTLILNTKKLKNKSKIGQKDFFFEIDVTYIKLIY